MPVKAARRRLGGLLLRSEGDGKHDVPEYGDPHAGDAVNQQEKAQDNEQAGQQEEVSHGVGPPGEGLELEGKHRKLGIHQPAGEHNEDQYEIEANAIGQ